MLTDAFDEVATFRSSQRNRTISHFLQSRGFPNRLSPTRIGSIAWDDEPMQMRAAVAQRRDVHMVRMHGLTYGGYALPQVLRVCTVSLFWKRVQACHVVS